MGRLCIDQNLELVHVRTKINELLQEKSEASSIVSSQKKVLESDNINTTTNIGSNANTGTGTGTGTGSVNKFISLDWCFVDCKFWLS